MSLINKVLKQLENKQQNFNSEVNPSMPSFSSSPIRKDRKKILLLLLVVLFFIVLIISITNKGSKTKNIPTKEVIRPSTITAKTAPAQQKVVTEPTIKLTDISLNVANNKTTIKFDLSQNTLYYLEHDDTQKHLTLTLSNTGIQAKSIFNLNHTAVKSLATKQINNNTVVYIEVLPETQVIGLQLYSQPKPQLQLVLLNSATPQGTVNKTSIAMSAEEISSQKYQKALDFIANDEPDEAISELKQAITKDPRNKKIRETLVTLLLTNNNFKDADKIVKQGIEITPYYPKFAELQAYIYIQQGNTHQAIATLEQNSPDVVSNPKYYALLANLYQKNGSFMQAARIYDQLTKNDPGNGIWWIGLGVALESADKKNAAREAYQNASYTSNLTPELRSFIDDKLNNR